MVYIHKFDVINQKQKMKNTLIIIITIVSIGFSINWMVKSNYEYEPIIVTLGLITFLIGLSASQISTNKSIVKGNSNKINQTIQKTDKSNLAKENQSRVDGEKNEIQQIN